MNDYDKMVLEALIKTKKGLDTTDIYKDNPGLCRRLLISLGLEHLIGDPEINEFEEVNKIIPEFNPIWLYQKGCADFQLGKKFIPFWYLRDWDEMVSDQSFITTLSKLYWWPRINILVRKKAINLLIEHYKNKI